MCLTCNLRGTGTKGSTDLPVYLTFPRPLQRHYSSKRQVSAGLNRIEEKLRNHRLKADAAPPLLHERGFDFPG